MSEIQQHHSASDSLDQTKDRVIIENNAQTIFDHIKSLENDPRNRQRWIWELLQNAEDASGDENLEVKIIWNGNNLIFCHNGAPFSEEDITHLIFHGSSKKEKEGKTGKFGTGFMTTHLLSKLVRIEGEISDGRAFDFILDRCGETPNEITNTLNQTWGNFKKSITNTSQLRKTKFSYLNLNSEGVQTVENVLTQTKLLIPPVMAFANCITRVIIENKSKIDVFEKQKSEDNISKIFFQQHNCSEKEIFHLLIHPLPDERGKIALPLDNGGAITTLDSEIPRLFITFPLVGTNKAFPLPFLINSPHFEPSSEREKIWLTEDTAEAKTNKSILETAFMEYVIVSKKLINDNADRNNFHLLANLGRLPDVEWLDREWYSSQIKFLIRNMDELSLIETCSTQNSSRISFNKSTIPFSYSKQNAKREAYDVWNLISKLKPESTPPESQIEFWFKIIADRETHEAPNPRAFTLKNLCEYIDQFDNHELDKLKSDLVKPLSFIIQLIQYLEKYSLQPFWNEYSILPNQVGKLKRGGELRQEERNVENEIGATIKDIAHQLGVPIKDSLLHLDIILTSNDFKLQFETKNAVVMRLLHLVKNDTPGEENATWIMGTIGLLNWILKNNRYNDLIGYPVKMSNSTWSRIQADRDPPFLCPVVTWRDTFQSYVELFPNDFILSENYSFIFEDKDLLQKAIQNKWFLKDPLYYTIDEFRGRDVLSMVTRRSDKDKLEQFENAEWKMKNKINFSQLAYIDSPKDKGVIDRIRGSAKRTKLFIQFILEVLIKEDQYGFTRFMIDVYDSEQGNINIGIYPSLWLLKLKEREWVKTLGGNTSERPTVESFLPYFTKKSEDPVLYKSLQRQEVSRFLHFFGIAVGDLLRNIRAGENEDERMEWDQSYVSILMNETLTPQKVTNMLSDSDFIKQYEEKKELEKNVAENQAIGLAIEKAFEEIFIDQSGYKITRSPIGQDYEAECDFDHRLLVEKLDGSKQKFLIEIKSSRSSEVKMTITQGFTACNTQERYILCVVPFKNEPISTTLVRNNAKFLTNIPSLLRDWVAKIDTIKSLEQDIVQLYNPNTDLIRTAIDGTQIRYAIQEKAWKESSENVLSFEEFICGLV